MNCEQRIEEHCKKAGQNRGDTMKTQHTPAIKRYDIEQYEEEWATMVESRDGDYVLYDDINVPLLAAAPELLEVLEETLLELISYIENYATYDNESNDNETVITARAAIAKARGEL